MTEITPKLKKPRKPKPHHIVTERSRIEVKTLAGVGLSQDDIAAYLGIATKTLVSKYKDELEAGAGFVRGNIANAAYHQAVYEKNVPMLIFLCKTKLRWRETDNKVELNGKSGSLVVNFVSDDDLDESK